MNNLYTMVTGAAGFMGTNLCLNLIAEGNNIIAVDDFTSGSRSNIQLLIDGARSKGVELLFIQHDVNDYNSLSRSIPIYADIPHIYHLACPASPVFYQRHPIHTLDTCYLGTRNILDIADVYDSRVVLTSTSEVYGDPLVHPQGESYRGNTSCTGARACYDEGKRIAETLLYNTNRVMGRNHGVVRLFNTYGPFMRFDDGRFISNFIYASLTGGLHRIYGDGSQTRSICFIDDIVRGLKMMMSSNIEGPINLGNPDEHTVMEWSMMISILTRTNHEYVLEPLPQDDPHRRQPDITLASELLGWNPEVDARTGLLETIDYFRSII